MQMMPWDAISLMETTQSEFTIPADTWTPVLVQDTGRIVVIFSSVGNLNTLFSLKSEGNTASHGLWVASAFEPVVLTNALHGPLTQMGWFAFVAGAPNIVSVFQVVLKKAPPAGKRG